MLFLYSPWGSFVLGLGSPINSEGVFFSYVFCDFFWWNGLGGIFVGVSQNCSPDSNERTIYCHHCDGRTLFPPSFVFPKFVFCFVHSRCDRVRCDLCLPVSTFTVLCWVFMSTLSVLVGKYLSCFCNGCVFRNSHCSLCPRDLFLDKPVVVVLFFLLFVELIERTLMGLPTLMRPILLFQPLGV